MIKDNIEKILENIDRIKSRNNLQYDIQLMAVTKTFPADFVLEAIGCGQTLFGENRILEAYEKYNSSTLKDQKYELHIIGHLQRNKVREAVEISTMIQSVDKIETLDVMENVCSKINKTVDYLIEINTSEESQKYWIYPDSFKSLLDTIDKKNYKFCNLRGLMTVGPLTENKDDIRKSFTLLKSIFDKVNDGIKKNDFDVLSMGMSGDYEIAIEEGSNLVRIGSAIFGTR